MVALGHAGVRSAHVYEPIKQVGTDHHPAEDRHALQKRATLYEVALRIGTGCKVVTRADFAVLAEADHRQQRHVDESGQPDKELNELTARVATAAGEGELAHSVGQVEGADHNLRH